MSQGPRSVKHRLHPTRHPAARRAPGGVVGVVGRYLVLSPKGNIADVGSEVRTARPGGPRTSAARGATPRPGEAAPGARAPSAPAARSPRAKPPPGGERPAPRRPRAGGWEPSAEPGPAPPPSPPAPRPAPARALPRGSLGGSPSARSPAGAPAAPRVRGLRGSARQARCSLPGSGLRSSQLSASLSHARPGPAARRLPGDRASPPRAALALAPDQAAWPWGHRPPRGRSTPRRLPEPGPRVRGERKARGAAGPEGTRRGVALTRGGSCALRPAARRLAPRAPRPAAGHGAGGGARPRDGLGRSFRGSGKGSGCGRRTGLREAGARRTGPLPGSGLGAGPCLHLNFASKLDRIHARVFRPRSPSSRGLGTKQDRDLLQNRGPGPRLLTAAGRGRSRGWGVGSAGRLRAPPVRRALTWWLS